MKIGFIGTGNMGRPMAERLIAAGHELAVYNRSRQKLQPLVGRGARTANTPGAAATGADLVISMLADDASEKSVLGGTSGVFQSGFRGVHVACTTLSVSAAREFAAEHVRAGLGYLACPVFGRPEAAAAGRLWGIAAGAASALEAARPALTAFTQGIFELGDRPEQANLVKLAGNFTLMAMIETLGEALALSEKAGVERGTFYEILTSTLFPTPVYRNYGSMIAERRFRPAGFSARLGLKDARLALAAAEELGVPLPLANLVHDGLVETLAKNRADWDWSALGQIAAEHANLAAVSE